jgi:hypothetical protein
VKVLLNEAFGFQRITVERPLLNEGAAGAQEGPPTPDSKIRDQENAA